MHRKYQYAGTNTCIPQILDKLLLVFTTTWARKLWIYVTGANMQHKRENRGKVLGIRVQKLEILKSKFENGSNFCFSVQFWELH